MAKVKEVLEDAKFNEFLGYEIEAYTHRPEPKEGLKYRRTPYDALKEKGLFTVEGVRGEFVKAANLESSLPSIQREAIVGLVFKVAQTVVNYRAKEEAEAIEYECTNKNPYGLKEYREGCTQHCDNCDYYQPIKN